MNSVSATRTAQIRSTSCLDYTQHRYRKYCLPRQQGRQGHPKRTSRESPAQVTFGALTSLRHAISPYFSFLVFSFELEYGLFTFNDNI